MMLMIILMKVILAKEVMSCDVSPVAMFSFLSMMLYIQNTSWSIWQSISKLGDVPPYSWKSFEFEKKKNHQLKKKKGCMIEIRLKHKGWEWAQILSKVLLDF